MMAETPVGEVLLTNVRLSFAHLDEPQEQEDDDGQKSLKFKCSGLISKTSAEGKRNLSKLKKASEQVKEKKWGNKQPKLKANQVCVRDGDQEDWDGYEGHYYISASNKKQPELITKFKRGDDWVPAKKGQLYSGCIVNMLVRLWAQDHPKYGKRLNASVEAVQFVKDGPAFGGGGPINTREKFAEIEADEGEDMYDPDADYTEDEEIDSLV
jgi:hypothetical protein